MAHTTDTATPGSSDAQSATGVGEGSAAGDAFSAEQVAALEERRRRLQSDRDRLQAENDALKRQADTSRHGTLTQDDVERIVAERTAQAMALTRAHAAALARFPHAHTVNPLSFQSADALEAAMQSEHERIASVEQSFREKAEADLRVKYVEAYGELPAAPAGGTGPGGGTSTLNAEKIAGMTLGELNAISPKDLLAIARGSTAS